jgi:DNA-binding response OmpR family regulator
MKRVLVLPLTWRELVVRLGAGVGPSGSGRESGVVRFGEVFADFSSMEVSRSEVNVALTTMEFKLLRFLVQNAGRVISRDEMLNEVWGYENYPCTRTVDNHILRLRQKLELDPTHPIHFRTVHGVGYKFVLEASRVVVEHKM